MATPYAGGVAVAPARLAAPAGPVAVVTIAVAVTALAGLESWERWPLAPFPLIHAALAIVVPLRAGVIRLGHPLQALRVHRRILGALAIAALLYIGLFAASYAALLDVTRRSGDPTWDLLAQYTMLGRLYVERHGWTAVYVLGYLLAGVWPMFGEQFFYTGYLFGTLRRYLPPAAAAVVASALFGLRHALQLAYLWPLYPLPAGAAYCAWAAGFAILWAWAFHRSGSLWPCILTHAANLILAPMVFILLRSRL